MSPAAQRKLDARASLLCAVGAFLTIVCSATGATVLKWMLLVWPVGIVATLAIVGVAAIWGLQRQLAGRSPLRPVLVSAACLALTISTLFTAWPLGVAFMCSRISFDAVAARVRAGETITQPFWIGPHRILKATWAENGNPVICLWTDLDSSGHTGFVRTDPGQPPPTSLLNLWSHQAIDGTWYFVSED